MIKLLEVHNLSYSFGKVPVLHQINLKLPEEQIMVLIGPNGSGKSTLLRCLAGMYDLPAGRVILKGKDVRDYKRKQLAREICLLPQSQLALSDACVYDLVAMGRNPYQNWGWFLSKQDREKIEWALAYMKLKPLQDRGLHSLSGGERQRVWIAMILAQDTPVVLMDEPVTFLDLRHQWDLLQKIQEIRTFLHKSFIIVLHDVNHALCLADQVLVLKNGGTVRQGTPSEVITAELMREVYGINVRVCTPEGSAQPLVIPQEIVKS